MAHPKVLILIDRIPGQALGTADSFGISYSLTPDPTDLYYFTFSHVISTLRADVIKAHRQTDPASDHGAPTPAHIENFRFTTASLSDVDVVWLIGYNSVRPGDPGLTAPEIASTLDDNELAVLTTFMNAGGGVFASGDHAGLGLSLAGRVPRVRTMRKWWYPTPGTFKNEPIAPAPLQGAIGNRLDTTRPGNTAPIDSKHPDFPAVWFDDQSDDTPQYIVPETGKNLCYEPIVYQFNPKLLHPLLQGSLGPILAFPDHMHEGEVILPYEYDRVFSFSGSKFEEYPSGAAGQVKPQIVAWSATNGAANIVPDSEIYPTRRHVGDDEISPMTFFGAIGAYDGRLVGVGRVVVQSTFHHLMDINLIGDPAAPAGDAKQQGFLASPRGRAILTGIEDYFNNVVQWLAPPRFTPKPWLQAIATAMAMQPLRDVARTPPPNSERWLGKTAVASVTSIAREGMLMSWLRDLLPEEISRSLPALPWGPVTGSGGCGSVDQQAMLHSALGHAVIKAAAHGRVKGNHKLLTDPEAQKQILEATIHGVRSLSDDIERRGKAMVRLAGALRGEHRSE